MILNLKIQISNPHIKSQIYKILRHGFGTRILNDKLSKQLLTLFFIAGVVVYFLFPSITFAIDTAPPDSVSDLRVESSTDSSLTLAWTAPGDDGPSGTVSQYDLRMDNKEILFEEAATAPIVGGEPQPVPGGEMQRMTITGLLPSTQYWFVIKSQDRLGNTASFSNIATGTTAFDTTPPSFNDIAIVDLTAVAARVVWQSNEPATSSAQFGETTSYGLYAMSNGYVVSHSLPLGGLRPCTIYHYLLRSVDEHGNEASSVDRVFTTPSSSGSACRNLEETNNADTPVAETQVPSLIASPTPSTPFVTPSLTGTVTFTPSTLNLKSNAAWLVAVLRLPKEARAGMRFSSLRMNGKVPPDMSFREDRAQEVLTRYGTLWMKFPRKAVYSIVPPEVDTVTLTLTGETDAGMFSASADLAVTNNITQAAWEKQQAQRRIQFEANKKKTISGLEQAIAALKKKLEDLERQLRRAQDEVFE